MQERFVGDIMVTTGYAIKYRYADNGTTEVQVRIPNVHGPMNKSEYNGKTARNYVEEEDLPYFMSVIMPHMPSYGDVVVLESNHTSQREWTVIGMTGGNYKRGA